MNQLHDLSARGMRIETARFDRIEAHVDVVLTDGRHLGNSQIHTSETKKADIAGAFNYGDSARAPYTVSLAVADGACAGAKIHRFLVWPEG